MSNRSAAGRLVDTTADVGATTFSDEEIYRAVHDAILDHRLTPETKLTEDALGDVFGVSRTVVRKALLRLAHENMVRIRPNRGTVVASPSVEEARHVFEARRVVESSIVGIVGKSISADKIDELRTIVVRERAAHDARDRRKWIRLSGQFHICLAEMAGNDVLTAFLTELVSRTSLIIALYESQGAAACSLDEHLAIIDALEAGDPGHALTLMNQHLVGCEKKLDLEPMATRPDLTQVFADFLTDRESG